MQYIIIMISSVTYKPKSIQLSQSSTFRPSKSPLFQIVITKIIIIILIVITGSLCSQQIASMVLTVGSGLQFWLTKNMGRKYLQAAWSIDTSQQEQIWIYQASFKSPQYFEEFFWYSQIIYGIFLIFAAAISSMFQKYSLVCAIVIAFTTNYVNFFAFSKIINMRNAGIFDMIAQQANAQEEIRQTIRLPLIYRSNSQNFINLNAKSINRSSYV